MRTLRIPFALATCLLAGCGFHLVGKGTTLPEHIQSIAVPVFRNETRREEIEQQITFSVMDEIAKRGRAKTTGDPSGADAVLTGSVKSFEPRPVTFDSSGRATQVELTIIASVKFEDRREGKMIWENPSFLFRSLYPVTGDPETYFDREREAVELAAQEFARSVVSTIFEGF